MTAGSAGPAAQSQPDHREQLGRGFNWLGGAMVLARVVDFATVAAMLFLLTKQQVGVASVVVSVGMVVEAFNGLGTGEALLQAGAVSRAQLDTLFWYVLGAALLIAALVLLAAPLADAVYGGGIARYAVAIALKQPVVGAALIPLALMNRDLQYRRIATVNLCATCGAALTRLGLGLLGAGAWALVAGYAASGLFVLAGALVARPFRPRLVCRPRSILPLVRFGAGAGAANIGEQMFKNIDFLLVGWLFGPALLATYRVAFDVAMEPAMAVATLVNRTALPVFARAAAAGGDLAGILTWSMRRTLVLVAPLLAALFLVAGEIAPMLHDARGASYAGAALPLRLLCAAALLRVLSQLLPTVMLVSRRPAAAAGLSAATFLLLTTGILAVGFGARHWGIAGVAGVWLAAPPLLLAWGFATVHSRWRVQPADLWRAARAPLSGAAAMMIAVALAPTPRIATASIATVVLYSALFRHEQTTK